MDGSAATIAIDLPCVRCGYNLRGVTPQTQCPECGLAAHRSAAGERLADASPQWVAKVSTGTALLAAAYFGPAVSIGLPQVERFQRIWWLVPLVTWVFFATHAVGAFLLAAPEPRTRRGAGLAAWTLRLASLGPVIAVPLFWYLMLRSTITAPYLTMLNGLNVPFVLCPALALLRVSRLLRRVDRPKLAAHAAIAGCALSGLSAVILLFALISWAQIDFAWAAAGTLAAAVLYFWCVVVLQPAAYFLRAAAREARHAWREADAR